MTTSFSTLPIIDLKDVSLTEPIPSEVAARLGEELYDVFATTGFAYLINSPLTFDHAAVFDLARDFFELPTEEKLRVAKRTFQSQNSNTYRGYFPAQPLSASDNLKEGFEIGPAGASSDPTRRPPQTKKINLAEPNVWPSDRVFTRRVELEQLHGELQNLSSQLLSLLALSLGKSPNFFDSYLQASLSTLRLLHYPLVQRQRSHSNGSQDSLSSSPSSRSVESQQSSVHDTETSVKLSCTPHTDSGILTLLHQDATGGLEVRNSLGQWVPAPYVPGSIVVNIGDLMAEVSGGRFVATMHRVRAPMRKDEENSHERPGQLGRFSVPFFFEPGEDCVVKSVDDDGSGHGILYGDHVRQKMMTWVEFQDQDENDRGGAT